MALWKRGEIEYLAKKLQDKIQNVEMFGIKWGFRFPVEKKN